jgi:hypothetical protein
MYVFVSISMCMYRLVSQATPKSCTQLYLAFFSITNIISEVIFVHIPMYFFILTCIGSYVLVNECINVYVIYMCVYVVYYYCQPEEGFLRGSGSSVLLQV